MKELEIGAELENMEMARSYVTEQLEEAGFAVLESRSSEGWFSFTCRAAERR